MTPWRRLDAGLLQDRLHASSVDLRDGYAGMSSGVRAATGAIEESFPAMSMLIRRECSQIDQASLRNWLSISSTPTGAIGAFWCQRNRVQHLAWSPDGSSLAYDTDTSIWRVDLATATPVLLTTDDPRPTTSKAGQPAWSPDGNTIAYSRFQTCFRCTAIWVINSDGTSPRQIYEGDFQPRRPTFRPTARGSRSRSPTTSSSTSTATRSSPAAARTRSGRRTAPTSPTPAAASGSATSTQAPYGV